MKRKLTEEFKKECVKERLRGIDYKQVCEKYKIHPPQLNTWMKEYAGLPEFKELKRLYDVSHERKQSTTQKLMAKPTNVLMSWPMGTPHNAVRRTELHALLARWKSLKIHYDTEEKLVKVYDEYTLFPPECLSQVAEVSKIL